MVIIDGNIDGNFELVDLKLTDAYVVDFALIGSPYIFNKLDNLSDFFINDCWFYWDLEVKIFLKFLSNEF